MILLIGLSRDRANLMGPDERPTQDRSLALDELDREEVGDWGADHSLRVGPLPGGVPAPQ
jgi:hypothetical protein